MKLWGVLFHSKVAAKVFTLILFLAGAVALPSCLNNSGKIVSVGRHTFKVPEQHLVKGSIPWLPSSQSDGLRFIINPDSRPQEQMFVGVDDYRTICNPSNQPTSNMLLEACQDAKAQFVNQNHALMNVRKVHPNADDKSQWQYSVSGINGEHRVIATCYALDSGGGGLCRSLKNYKDLVFSVGFRDSEIANLSQIWKTKNDMLSSWEEK